MRRWQRGLARFGAIDALVNNAGYGAYGPLEAFSMDGIRRQFDTNVIGLLATTKAVLPHMRAAKSGTIVNISSIGGKMTFPLGTLYHGSKFAVEGLSEALHYELEPLGVRVKIVEPGMIKTDFGGRSFDFQNDESLVRLSGPGREGVCRICRHERCRPPRQVWLPMSSGRRLPMAQISCVTPPVTDAAELMANRKALDDETFIGGLKTQFGL
jgi:NAD(P)-dependent dehydrogenase (short-subunit alcohol dehydrogenase family)